MADTKEKSAQVQKDEEERKRQAMERVEGRARVDESFTETDPMVMDGPLYEKVDNSEHPHAFGIRTLEDEEQDRIQNLLDKQENVGVTNTAVDEINATGGVSEDERNEIRKARGQDDQSTQDLVDHSQAQARLGKDSNERNVDSRHASERSDNDNTKSGKREGEGETKQK